MSVRVKQQPLLLLEGPNEARDPYQERRDAAQAAQAAQDERQRQKKLKNAVSRIVGGPMGPLPEYMTATEMPWDDGPTEPWPRNSLKNLSWPRKLAMREKFTPDFSDLKLQSQILIFVYGEEKRECSEHKKLLDGAIPLGGAHTLMDHYIMAKHKFRDPLVFEQPKNERGMRHPLSRRIRGEAYLVSVEHIHVLDGYHMNTINNKRGWKFINFETEGVGGDVIKQFRGKPAGQAFMWTADPAAFSLDKTEICVAAEVKSMNPLIGHEKYYQW